MNARKKPYWPAPGRPTSRFEQLIQEDILLDHIWRGQHASYRVLHGGIVKTWSWVTIRKMFPPEAGGGETSGSA